MILIDTKAAVSSSFGIVSGFSGATHDLAVAREQRIWPESLVNLSTCMDLIKHALCVAQECYWFLAKLSKYANQVIGLVRTLKQVSVKRFTRKLYSHCSQRPL